MVNPPPNQSLGRLKINAGPLDYSAEVADYLASAATNVNFITIKIASNTS
jgi:hypothetical protein